MTYLTYVRQSLRLAADADVSPEQQEAAAKALLPPGRPQRSSATWASIAPAAPLPRTTGSAV